MRRRDTQISLIAERCKECGFCIEFCPRKTLVKSTEINSRGYHIVCLNDNDKCTGCNICGMVCPEFAISVTSTDETTEEAGLPDA